MTFLLPGSSFSQGNAVAPNTGAGGYDPNYVAPIASAPMPMPMSPTGKFCYKILKTDSERKTCMHILCTPSNAHASFKL